MNCKVCDSETEVVFNVRQTAVPICQACASSIFVQQAMLYSRGGSIFNQKKVRKIKKHPQVAANLLNYINEKLGKKHRYEPDSIPDTYLSMISARINDGYTEKQLMAVAYDRWNRWKKEEKMIKFYRPDTLFNKSKFTSYIFELPETLNPENTKEQRDLIRKLNNFGTVCNEETDKVAKELMAIGYTNKRYLNLYLIEKI